MNGGDGGEGSCPSLQQCHVTTGPCLCGGHICRQRADCGFVQPAPFLIPVLRGPEEGFEQQARETASAPLRSHGPSPRNPKKLHTSPQGAINRGHLSPRLSYRLIPFGAPELRGLSLRGTWKKWRSWVEWRDSVEIRTGFKKRHTTCRSQLTAAWDMASSLGFHDGQEIPLEFKLTLTQTY